jgi:hypothetical protein
MADTIKTISITSLFNQPRILYTEMMRKRFYSEAKGVLTLLRFYREHHSDTILSTDKCYSADDIIQQFLDVSIRLHQANTLSDVRMARQKLIELKHKFDQPLESVFFAMSILHGFED